MSLSIGIDIGTSSAKAVVVNRQGDVVFKVGPTYNFKTPHPLWAESDPEDWWKATLHCLEEISKACDPASIEAIGLTGQMHGLVLLDAAGRVLRPCIMWNDQRTSAECAALTQRVGAQEVLRITGNPVLTGFTAPKILWVQKNEPKVWARVDKILLPKDFIRYRLSGVFATDVSDASGMSLLDVGARNWSQTMLAACGVKPSMLGKVHESPDVTGTLNAELAKRFGFRADVKIVAGAGDQAAGAVGSGVVKQGLVACSLGTSGVVFAQADQFEPEPEGRLHAFCAAVPGKWHYMGVQLSCAGSYQWFGDRLGFGADFRVLDAEAEKVGAGAEGLLFLPYLTGERMPHPDPLARGGWIGLTIRHGRGHMARAVLEGVTFGLREGMEMIRKLGVPIEKVIVAGGGARSPLWRQILADNFESSIVTVNASEGGAFGAAILAMVGAGWYPGVEAACGALIRETGETLPGPNTAAYNRLFPVYKGLYPALKESFAALS